MSKDDIKMTVLVPRELHEAAKAKAKGEDVTLSQIVRWYLRAWVQGDTPRVVPRPDTEQGDA